MSTADAASVIQKPEAEARARLQRLVEFGLLEARGERKARTWHLAAATYRRLGDKSGYVRQRGFEPIQQEQMILQYVRRHGRITRREAAELCRLEPRQAGRLLARLVNAGKLTLYGARRGAWYELTS
jgi:ATP-dependent DNA helicase RecG